jgi:hypothetical protein
MRQVTFATRVARTSVAYRLFPPRGATYGPFQRLRKSRITRERWKLDEKGLQNANSKSGSPYRMVKLFPPRGAT